MLTLAGSLVEAIIKAVLTRRNRLRVLFLVVKLGIPGTQKSLNAVLFKHGSKSMCEDYLNSGSKELGDGGERWANSHGYKISSGGGSHRVSWGSF